MSVVIGRLDRKYSEIVLGSFGQFDTDWTHLWRGNFSRCIASIRLACDTLRSEMWKGPAHCGCCHASASVPGLYTSVGWASKYSEVLHGFHFRSCAVASLDDGL